MASIYPPNDPYWSNVVLLMDGSSPTQDLSEDNRTVTKYGDVVSALAPSSPVELALLFNRTGSVDYLIADSAGVTLSQDWCFECRIYITAYSSGTGTSDLYMLWKPWNGTSSGCNVEIKGNGKWSIFFSSPRVYSQSSDDVPLGKFVHLAATCVSDVHRLFINGKLQTLSTGGTSITSTMNPGTKWVIGGDSDVGNGRSLDGYMRDVRITFGQGRYTSDFTPPVPGSVTGGNAIMFSCNT